MNAGDHRVLQEEGAWEAVAADVLGDGAQLVSVSQKTPDSRLYRLGARAAKIRRHVDPPRRVSLEREAWTLRLLGHDAQYAESGSWEILRRPWFEGTPLLAAAVGMPFRDRVALAKRLLREVVRLRRAALPYGGLYYGTALAAAGSIVLLGDQPDRNSLTRVFAGLLLPRFSGLRKRVESTLAQRRRAGVARAEDNGNHAARQEDIETLRVTWHLGRTGGERFPYYAFTYQGVHFPGARPWYLRWEPIRRGIDFRNKRVVELGCNMGLLSSFAMIHGAASAMGVDHEPHVVESARLVARALGSGAEFATVDLVADADWEKTVGPADIVTMLSVMNWLPPETQQRALRFLARHSEVLYEGHDPLEVETQRLRSAGFDEVHVLAQTDRNRRLLYGRKSPAASAAPSA